jgi:hypothetical protein
MARLGVSKKKKSPRATELSQLKKEVQRLTEQLESRDREQTDPAADLGNLSSLSLTELIVETGIHDAIARKLNEKGKLSNNAIAEGIINNVRKTIIRDQLTDPKFYDQMSKIVR